MNTRALATQARTWIRTAQARPGGIEPPACGLEGRCSSPTELRARQHSHKSGSRKSQEVRLETCRLATVRSAGSGNRTRVSGLEGQGSTIELYPHARRERFYGRPRTPSTTTGSERSSSATSRRGGTGARRGSRSTRTPQYKRTPGSPRGRTTPGTPWGGRGTLPPL